ncbi:type IX secretion system sortase PorU [Algoriphagus namhaensis]|uniref:Type IX secretion system sortase PorU n=1 Tax=Algoriphagus namhaensis TaxID=915353 RepID=A0ABV8AS33_9BACT
MILNWRCWFCLVLLGFTALDLNAQNSFRKIQVVEEGIYKIERDELSQISSDLSQIAVFGYPGSLPQKLSPEDLRLHQIPILETEDGILVFLSGPNRWEKRDSGWSQEAHQWTDTLTYLIGIAENPKRVAHLELEDQTGQGSTLYRWKSIRDQQTNLLNSGRTWYGPALSSGASQVFTFQETSSNNLPWLLKGSFMAQSLSSSEMSVAVDSEGISDLTFSPIPDAIYGIKGRTQTLNQLFTPNDQSVSEVSVSYTANAPNSSGYMEYLTLGIPSSSENLENGIWYTESEDQVFVQNPNQKEVWDVTDFFNPKQIYFENQAIIPSVKLAVFEFQSVQALTLGDEVQMDLMHNIASPELLIISHPSLLPAANRLAAHKSQMGIQVETVDVEEVFDSFSYGNRDVVGIRNFIASRFQNGQSLKNVLILGKGTFDGKSLLGGRPSLVPIYTSRESLNPLATFSSDDFYGLVDFGQGEWLESREGDELMQLGVGRLPVITLAEANAAVDKIIQYESNPSPGDWKRTLSFFADDADNNIHMRDAEAHSEYLYQNHRSYFQDKLYLDRFEQISQGSGQNSPQAEEALKETLDRGTLLLNYIGHGNETTLTAEEVFQLEDLRDWGPQENLALWVTATCEFGRHDSPFIRSAAEELLIAPEKGAIGLLTTGRPVFSSVNFRLNEAFIEEVFARPNGESQDLGTIFRNTKNKSLNGALNRNFSLLGDPSMKLADPDLGIEITSLKNVRTGLETDTLSAFQEIELLAQVIDPLSGAVQNGFDGDFLIDLRDKPVFSKTLGDESSTFEFQEEKALLFRGKGKIKSGMLRANFVISSNINYEYGDGALRIFGSDANGIDEAFGGKVPIVGGSDTAPLDTEGPVIRALFNGISKPTNSFNSSQIILDLDLEDESGINISGIIPGQELQIIINGGLPQIISGLYLADAENFKKGTLTTTVKGLKEGENKILIRAWDNLGNSSSLEQTVIVSGSEHIQILSHHVFPNPAASESNFKITHNRPDENLVLILSVYSTGGNILFSESQRLVGVSSTIEGIKWIFLQNQTKYPAKGTYIYKLSLFSEVDNTQASVSGKIIVE